MSFEVHPCCQPCLGGKSLRIVQAETMLRRVKIRCAPSSTCCLTWLIMFSVPHWACRLWPGRSARHVFNSRCLQLESVGMGSPRRLALATSQTQDSPPRQRITTLAILSACEISGAGDTFQHTAAMACQQSWWNHRERSADDKFCGPGVREVLHLSSNDFHFCQCCKDAARP